MIHAAELSEVEKAFSAAILDVIATMAGLMPQKAPVPVTVERGITGAMTLVGKKSLLATISMPVDTAGILVSYMTGIYISELTGEDICDGVAELVNMVCGRAKTMLADTDYSFTLTSPFVITGEKHNLYHKSNVVKVQSQITLENAAIGMELIFP